MSSNNPNKRSDKNKSDQSWFLRRHSYGPDEIGMTDPPESQATPPEPSIPAGDMGSVVRTIGRTNELLYQILRMHQHDKITEFDIDISDSVSYTLAPSQAAIVSYTVPPNYVMIMSEFFTTLTDDSTYYVYLDDELFQYASDMSFIGAMGLAISPGVEFSMYVLNTYSASQKYISSIKASVRRAAHWDYPTYSYKKPV